jgi:hypothetical protein
MCVVTLDAVMRVGDVLTVLYTGWNTLVRM